MPRDDLAEAFTARGLSDRTIAGYCHSIRRAERWLATEGHTLDDVEPVMLRRYSETLPFTHWSRAALRSALRAYWLVTGRHDAPIEAIRRPSKPRMRCRALDDVPAAALEAAARRRGDRKGIAVLIGLYGALRREEIGSVRFDDIDDGWLTVIGKGDVTRSIPLHPVLLEALGALSAGKTRQRPKGSEWIFPGRFGGPVNPATVWDWVREVAEGAGLGPVKTHVLRHTALTTMLDATHDLRAVQEFAGHSRPETTAGYTRVRRDRLVAAVTAIDYG